MKVRLGYRYQCVRFKSKKTMTFEALQVSRLYAKEIARILKDGGEILFCDESSFGRKPHRAKRWSKGRGTQVIKSDGRVESVSLILTISKDLILYYEFEDETVNSNRFKLYIAGLVKRIKLNKIYRNLLKANKLYLYLDGASIHSTPDLQKTYKETGLRVIQPPPYSPELNPVEYVFSTLKKLYYSTPITTR